MTNPKMDQLQAAVQNADDGDFLRELIGFAAQRLMDLEVEAFTGAGYGERSPERQTRRNGYRDRQWQTRAGAVDLQVPKLRQGSYFPSFLEPRRATEKALVAVIQEASAPPRTARSPSAAISLLRDGAMPPMPPI